MKRLILVSAMVIFLVIGCSHGGDGLLSYDDCGTEMEDIIADLGSPEEIYRYDSGSYHSVDYWYWSRGICYTFTWDTSSFSCEVSTYSFPPLYFYSSLTSNSILEVVQIQEAESSVLIFESRGQYAPILKITCIGVLEIPTVTVITETDEYDVELASIYFLEGVVLHGVIDKPAKLVSVCVDNTCINF